VGGLWSDEPSQALQSLFGANFGGDSMLSASVKESLRLTAHSIGAIRKAFHLLLFPTCRKRETSHISLSYSFRFSSIFLNLLSRLVSQSSLSHLNMYIISNYCVEVVAVEGFEIPRTNSPSLVVPFGSYVGVSHALPHSDEVNGHG